MGAPLAAAYRIPVYIPTLPGKLFFLKELAGPLVADTN